MIERCRSRYEIFNADYVFETSNTLEFSEKNKSGAGSAIFQISGTGIVIKSHNNPPLVWSLKIRNCADGAFITFADDEAHLHLVELKSGLSQKDWAHAIEQFRGMYFSSIAAGKLLGIEEFSTIRCYISYKTLKMATLETISPVLIKTLVGKRTPLGGQNEWEKEVIEFPLGHAANLVKSQRDDSGNSDFGQVA